MDQLRFLLPKRIGVVQLLLQRRGLSLQFTESLFVLTAASEFTIQRLALDLKLLKLFLKNRDHRRPNTLAQGDS